MQELYPDSDVGEMMWNGMTLSFDGGYIFFEINGLSEEDVYNLALESKKTGKNLLKKYEEQLGMGVVI